MCTWGDHECVALLQFNPLAHRGFIAEKDVPLFPWQHPVLIELQVLRCGRDQPEHLRSFRTRSIRTGNYETANQQWIISEGSWDTWPKTGVMMLKIQLIAGIKYILKYTQIEKVILNWNISQYYWFKVFLIKLIQACWAEETCKKKQKKK